ncbi:hypothetical protein K7432_013273 [Basidiobolus ranarum]|uniref:Uncharacterized protein n=1 Tax=Basidiobolus ranarum TaxID=34480 RepID=A0ABR2VR71_9FUNG
MKSGDKYICTHEDYRHINDHSLRHSDKDIFWQKIEIPVNNKAITRMATLSYACCLNKRDLSDIVGEGVNLPFKAAMGVRFKISGKDSGFVLIYSSDETWSLPEQEVELFEDIVGQIEIALQQSAQLRTEHNIRPSMSTYNNNAEKQNYSNERGLASLRQSAIDPIIPSSSPPPFSSEDIQEYEEYDMEPKYWN